MKATVELDLQPFTVPYGVSDKRSCSFFSNTIPLSDLSPEVLAVLCEEFTQSVFEGAGKERPTPTPTMKSVAANTPRTKPPKGATHFAAMPEGNAFFRVEGQHIGLWESGASAWIAPLPDTIPPTLTRIGQGDK